MQSKIGKGGTTKTKPGKVSPWLVDVPLDHVK